MCRILQAAPLAIDFLSSNVEKPKILAKAVKYIGYRM